MSADHPFSAVHSRRLFLRTESRRQALARLDEGLGSREPFLVVTGDAGAGKTALVQEAIAGWDGKVTAAFVTNPALSRTELIEEIARRFGVEPAAGASKPQILAQLDEVLTAIEGRGQIPMLVVEDAQDLAEELFEELRLLANAQSQAGRKLEMLLVGLPGLDARLSQPELAAIRQRIALRCEVTPLSHKETRRYLHHRAGVTGLDGERLFPPKTCDAIHARTRGVPRAVNALAAEAMRRAKEARAGAVSPEHVRAAAAAVVWAPGPAESKETAAPPARRVGGAEKEASTETNGSPAAADRPRVEVVPVASRTPEPPEAAAPAPKGQKVEKPAPAAAPAAASAIPVTNGPPPASSPAPGSATTVPATPAPAAVARVTAKQKPSHAPKLHQATSESPAAGTDVLTAPTSFERSTDPRVREWVTRFIGNDGPPRIGAQVRWDPLPADATPTQEIDEAFRLADADIAGGEEPTRSRSERRPVPAASDSRRRPGWSVGHSVAIGLLVLAALAAVILLPRWQRPMTARPTSSAAPAENPVGVEATAGSAITPVPAEPQPVDGPTGAPATGAQAPAQNLTRSGPGTAPEVSVPAVPPSRDVADSSASGYVRFTLEVATLIDLDRALVERDRLASGCGLEGWVANGPESGTYRILLGVFRTELRAEAAAGSLLERGVLTEAMVVSLPPRRSRR